MNEMPSKKQWCYPPFLAPLEDIQRSFQNKSDHVVLIASVKTFPNFFFGCFLFFFFHIFQWTFGSWTTPTALFRALAENCALRVTSLHIMPLKGHINCTAVWMLFSIVCCLGSLKSVTGLRKGQACPTISSGESWNAAIWALWARLYSGCPVPVCLSDSRMGPSHTSSCMAGYNKSTVTNAA